MSSFLEKIVGTNCKFTQPQGLLLDIQAGLLTLLKITAKFSSKSNLQEGTCEGEH